MVQPWNKDELFQPKETLTIPEDLINLEADREVFERAPETDVDGWCLVCHAGFTVDLTRPFSERNTCPFCGTKEIEY